MIKRESIKRGSIITSVYNMLGRILGFFSVFLISYYFGANSKTDVYYFMLSFTALLTALFTSLQSTIFLPLFIKTKEKSGIKSAWEFLNSLFTYTALFAVVLCLLFVFFPIKILSVSSHFTSVTLISSKFLIIMFAPIMVLMILSEFLRTIIQSHHQFTFPALIVFCTNLFMITLLVLFGKVVGVPIMVISILCSVMFQCTVMIYYIKKREPQFGVSFKLVHQHKEFIKLGLPVFITQVLGSLTMFFYDYSATMFAAGTLTAIAFAQRIFNLPNDMLITPISNVATPLFSEDNVKENKEKLHQDYTRFNNIVWLLIIPLSLFFILFSLPIVEILFKRGNFTEESVKISSISLKFFSFCLFGLSFNAISTRLYYSIQKTLWISISSLFINIFSILLTYFFVKTIGYSGIPLSRSVSVVFFSVGSCILFTIIYLKDFKINSLIVPFVKITLCSIIAGFFALVTYNYIMSSLFQLSFITKILLLTTVSLEYFIIYSLSCYLAKVSEYIYIHDLFKLKIRQILKF